MSFPCSRLHCPTFYHIFLLFGHCSPPSRPCRLRTRLSSRSRWFGGLHGCRCSLWSLLLHPILFHQVIHCCSEVHLLSHMNWIWKKIALFTQPGHEKNCCQAGQNQVGQLCTTLCWSYLYRYLAEFIPGLVRGFLPSEALPTFADLRFRWGFTC